MDVIGKCVQALRWCRIPFTFGEANDETVVGDAGDLVALHEGCAGSAVQSTSYNGLISSVQLFFTMTVVSVIFILSSYFCENIDVSLTLSALMGFGLYVMISVYVREFSESRRTADCERDNTARIGLVTFYFLATVHDFIHIISIAIHCGPVSETCTELFKKQMYHVTYHAVALIYCTGQTLFCWTFHRSTFSNKCATRHGLMILQSVNISLLFYILTEEAWENYIRYSSGIFDEYLDDVVNECVRKSNASSLEELLLCGLRNSTDLAWYKEGTTIMRSFRMEFTLLVAECLAHLYGTCGSLDKHSTIPNVNALCQSEMDHLSGNVICKSALRGRGTASAVRERNLAMSREDQTLVETTPLLDLSATYSKRIKISIIAVVLLNIALCVSTFYGNVIPYYLCIYLLMVTLAILLGYHFSRDFRVRPDVSFTGFDYLYLLSASASLAYNLAVLIALIGRNGTPVGIKVEEAVYVVCGLQVVISYLQVVFVLYCARIEPHERVAGSKLFFFRGIVLCLAICNGVFWFKKTFINRFPAREVRGDKLIRDVYGVHLWTVLNNILRPVDNFFLFNSCLLLIKTHYRLLPKK